ncbi:Isobutylamine N-hydroxylase [Pseudoalteromonas holothuriae]|uniref:Isobutylamine N-hydroxylase n=1 Tax=Pseudoalteromonas holothuriae TaxID=2963714 RepID=A0A9W4VUU8_9GAMM|nr:MULTISPECIES: acyl-CoA dehydrogenase family protein [unclassified Pseudoalteromonas]CAH9049573.1 Isobutylamine N-hydroxylase [Pseudoalteromonas sp. CIP111854]CAH9067318.1 Isobutylamine N-hydroxylase [Pseudoalteromonas sp. CIP111951]
MFLNREKLATEQFVPELATVLKQKQMAEREVSDGRELFQIFKNQANPGLMVGKNLGGSGADLVSAVRIHRYVGSLSPSLAIMMTMHNHTTYALNRAMDSSLAITEMVLTSVANDRLVFCSGFAEARPGANILSSSVNAQLNSSGDKFVITGSKKPCTMADFADLALVGIANPNSSDPESRGLLIVENMNAAKIEKVPFWPSSILTATSSNELAFRGLEVSKDNVALMETGAEPDKTKQVIEITELVGLSSFQVMVAASYLGAASRLAALCFEAEPANSTDVSQITIELETAALALEGIAAQIDSQAPSEELVATAIAVRTMVSQCIERANNLAVMSLGGMKYLGNEDVRYLLQVANCLNFHPLSRGERIDFIRHVLCNSHL